MPTGSKGTFQKRFSGFCPLRGYPPPYPLNGKSFCQKTLSGKGGVPPLPLTEKSAKTFLKGSLSAQALWARALRARAG